MDNSHIFITADHGGMNEGPTSPFKYPQTPCGAFKDNYLHVPMIYWNVEKPSQINNNLFGQIDFVPTICDILGIPKESTHKGNSMFSASTKNQYTIHEHTHTGPCDLKNKPHYVCVRTDNKKYIIKESVYHMDKTSLGLEEIYDLAKDPEERKNLINSPTDLENISELKQIALDRIKTIRNIKDNL